MNTTRDFNLFRCRSASLENSFDAPPRKVGKEFPTNINRAKIELSKKLKSIFFYFDWSIGVTELLRRSFWNFVSFCYKAVVRTEDIENLLQKNSYEPKLCGNVEETFLSSYHLSVCPKKLSLLPTPDLFRTNPVIEKATDLFNVLQEKIFFLYRLQ